MLFRPNNSSTDKLAAFNAAAGIVTAEFQFQRERTIVSHANLENNPDLDPDIYSGLAVATEGFFRVALHKPTNTLCLLASKVPGNLRGEKVDNEIIATRDGLEKSYIVAAYRNDPRARNGINSKIREALDQYCKAMSDRAKKHFTLYGTSVPGQDQTIFTNGRIAYVIRKTKKGLEATFYAPTRRQDGHFIPVIIEGNRLRDRFTRVSKIISKGADINQVFHATMQHWHSISSKLWDEKNIYLDEGRALKVKKKSADIVNFGIEHKQAIAITVVVSSILALFKNKLNLELIPLAIGFAYGLLHTGLDVSLERHLHKREKILKSKTKPLDQYPQGADVSAVFKSQDAGNLLKIAPKIDLSANGFKAEDFQFLDANASGLLLDHQTTKNGLIPESLRGLLLSAHERGFSSTCMLPDARTRLDIFQSGLVRLMHEQEDGKVLIYACYRQDACLNELQRLPEVYRNKLGEGIKVITYDRKPDFRKAFTKLEAIELDEIYKNLKSLLFKGQENIPDEVAEKSLEAILTAFRKPEDETTATYLSGAKPIFPDIRAVI